MLNQRTSVSRPRRKSRTKAMRSFIRHPHPGLPFPPPEAPPPKKESNTMKSDTSLILGFKLIYRLSALSPQTSYFLLLTSSLFPLTSSLLLLPSYIFPLTSSLLHLTSSLLLLDTTAVPLRSADISGEDGEEI